MLKLNRVMKYIHIVFILERKVITEIFKDAIITVFVLAQKKIMDFVKSFSTGNFHTG